MLDLLNNGEKTYSHYQIVLIIEIHQKSCFSYLSKVNEKRSWQTAECMKNFFCSQALYSKVYVIVET